MNANLIDIHHSAKMPSFNVKMKVVRVPICQQGIQRDRLTGELMQIIMLTEGVVIEQGVTLME